MTAHVFHMVYEVRPSGANEHWGKMAGAFVFCLILEQNPVRAVSVAKRAIVERHWEIVSVDGPPIAVQRQDVQDDAELCGYFDSAISNGTCLVYHYWPIKH